ncbi:MAG: hypothetical protein OEZ36_06605, partial [Spirochaetota bacterium]|nr:hypothetical protein [Spirochaetota bacterium]
MNQLENNHYNHKIHKAFRTLFLFSILSACALPGKMILEPFHKDMYMAQGVDSLPSKENRGFVSSAYAILTGEGWVVIDSLSRPELSEEFMKRLGDISGKPIKYLILTSHTPRLYHGVASFQKPGIQIIAHQNLNNHVDSEGAKSSLTALKKSQTALFSSVKLLKSHISVTDKAHNLKVGKYRFTLLSKGPAHSATDIVIHLKKEKLLFVGDLVVDKKVPYCGHPGLNIIAWLKALKKLKGLKPTRILTGTGGPTDSVAIDFTENYLNYLYTRVSESLRRGLSLRETLSAMRVNPYQFLPMYEEYHGINVQNLYG